MSGQLWRVRGKGRIGRPRLFETPEDLWNGACEYFNWCDEHPWIKRETNDKGSGLHPGEDIKEIPTARPYTMWGLCVYLDCSESYFTMAHKFFAGIDDELLGVIRAIQKVVRTQQLEGGTTNTYNASIVASIVGLTTKIENNNRNINYDTSVSKDEAKQISKDLEDDC